MGRKRKGRPISGWIIVDKPAGPTSTAIVNKVRWAFEASKAGHAGTLDPDATGLLAIALGEATKTIPLLTDALKAYDFTVVWGAATNTDDAQGEIVARSDQRPDDVEIREALPLFTGDIMQVPPQFSAVKVDGVRAYAKARDGEEMELAARPLYVDRLEMLSRDAPDRSGFRLVCGKGGYVRAIARDLGAHLGCLGHVERLRRVWSGPFHVNDAIEMEQIEMLARTPEIDEVLRPIEAGLSGFPKVTVNAIASEQVQHGNSVDVLSSEAEFGETVWASHQGRALAIGQYRAGRFHPSRVLHTS